MRGTTDISSANVAVLVIDPDTEIKKAFQTIIDIQANATVSGNFTFATAQIAPKAYIAELQVTIPETAQTRTLASDTFIVRHCIEVSKTIPDVQRVLVWLNYAWDTGQDCPDRAVIEQALKDAGVRYRIVLDKKDFQDELRSPWYTDIMILGTFNPIEDHIAKELREQVNNGKGLIASLFSRKNIDQEVFGIDYINALPGRDYPIELEAGDLWDADVFQAAGRALDVEALQPADVMGWIIETTNQDTVQHPAIVKHTCGLGKALYYAFDIGLSTENYGKFGALLDTSLQYVHTAGPTGSFTPGKMVPVEITVKSQGGEFDLRLTESYPAEIKLYDAETGQRITENPWVIEVSLGSNETKTMLYYALAPAEAGIFKLQTTVEYREAGIYRYFTDVFADIKVKKSAEEITGDIITALQALFVTARK